MKSEKLIELIRHPEKVSNEDLRELDDLVCRYPFFQTARILYLKALHLKAGPRFRNELKVSTVHITDHKQLLRYLNRQLFFESTGEPSANTELDERVDERIREIDGHIEVTSPGIPAYPVNRRQDKQEENETVSLNFPETAPARPAPKVIERRQTKDTPVISNPILLDDIPGVVNDYDETGAVPPMRPVASTPESPAIPLPDLSGIPGMMSEKTAENPPAAVTAERPALPPMELDLEHDTYSEPAPPQIGVPLETPEIPSAAYRLAEENTAPPAREKRKKKNQLIEQFIQTAPTMPKIKATTDSRDLSKENPFSPDDLFSETLAKIYIRQGLYRKAIATYIKLSLKYPEKSVYFADRIEKIKQNINNQE